MKKFTIETYSRKYVLPSNEVSKILIKHLEEEHAIYLADKFEVRMEEDGTAVIVTIDSSEEKEKR